MATSTSKQNHKHIDDLHFEHKVWERQLEFFKGEIDFFKRRLEEVSARYTAPEMKQKTEHFQNQFIIQRDEIDRFLHGIHVHEDELAAEAKRNPVAVNHRLLEDHPEERERFATFEKLYTEMKGEYMIYLRRYM